MSSSQQDRIFEMLSEPLDITQIDFRVQSINRGGYATILAYKDARVDMQRLDKVVGPLNWKREHINGNHNCIVSVWCPNKLQWVSKEDTGTESNTEAAKGLASDSFKRACFNWGIGRELYDYPVIHVKLDDDEWEMVNDKPRAKYKLNVREWVWFSQWEDGELIYLAARDNKKLRFEYGSHRPDGSSTVSVCNLIESVYAIKKAIAEGDYSSGAEAWKELSDKEQHALWVAPTKGGVFSTRERQIIRSPEFLDSFPDEPAARGIVEAA
jgi:hypothetical protein